MTDTQRSRRPVAHHRAPAARPGRPNEHGYTMVMTALLLVPLIAFAGFAVDIGAWYARGAQVQRAADSAALAGAALMPDFAAAKTEALKAASKNGFTPGGTIAITVTQVDERKISVTIVDSNVTRYFSSLFITNMKISRIATAEFVLPVPLGSPTNYFGNDPVTPPSAGQPGLWGNIHGPKTDQVKGDRYATGCRDSSGCASQSNPEYRGYYYYAIDVPSGTGTMSVDVYDAGMYSRATEQTDTGDTDYSGSNNSDNAVSNFLLTGPDSTALDFLDATSPASCPGSPAGPGKGRFTLDEEADAATYKNKWVSLCTITSPTAGSRYWLKVWTSGNGDIANRYALRVTSSTATKPTLSAYRDMSMFNNQLTVTPSFYLAKVDQIHRNKTFIVNLYDPGEIGSKNASMQILDPAGTVATKCTVAIYDDPTDVTPSSTTTKTPCSVPTTDNNGAGLYNGKLVSMSIAIPSTYTCTVCWWKVRYDLGTVDTGATAADTTTWSAAIKGDPVHLVTE